MRHRFDGEAGNGADNIDRDGLGMRDGFTGKDDAGEEAMLGLDALELVEDQVAERVKDCAPPVALPTLDHVRMMAGDDTRSGVDGGSRELDLPRVGTRRVFEAGVHGDDAHVGAL
ncbi:MAG TPA: hypothetical protein VK419_17925, partial [Bryobacteraceae bacterium]|nr:hypothetical protein [Bryobacteraceae bacterium]